MDRLWAPWRYNYVSKADGGLRKGVPAALAAWPLDQDKHCVFCNLVASADYAIAQGMAQDTVDREAKIVYRGEQCFICLNIFPYASGHLLILPYEHTPSLARLPAPAAAEMMLLAQRTEEALRETYRPEGLNFGLNLGESAGAGVAAHLHMHALPRWTGDTNFMTVVAETRVLPETLDASWDKLKIFFTNVQHAT